MSAQQKFFDTLKAELMKTPQELMKTPQELNAIAYRERNRKRLAWREELQKEIEQAAYDGQMGLSKNIPSMLWTGESKAWADSVAEGLNNLGFVATVERGTACLLPYLSVYWG